MHIFRANDRIDQVVFIHKDALQTIMKFKEEHLKILKIQVIQKVHSVISLKHIPRPL